MGLFQYLSETYDTMVGIAGVEIEGKETLAPFGHITAKAEIEITIDADGSFISAESIEKKIVIPVTEASSGRSSAPAPHCLCDNLSYVSSFFNEQRHKLYKESLREWAESEYSHPKVVAICKYIQGNSIAEDLTVSDLWQPEKKDFEKTMVCFNCLGFGSVDSEVWKDRELQKKAYGFILSKKQADKAVLCAISGQEALPAKQHIKGVYSLAGNAKLISANDDKNFTFRGRFTKDAEALTVGYEPSQKAHNALKWLIANYGEIVGGRVFVCWNPKGKEVPKINFPFIKRDNNSVTMTDYRNDLARCIYGYKVNFNPSDKVIIASFEAATTGRLSVVYYNEFVASDFLERIKYWDETCVWMDSYQGNIYSPNLLSIAEMAYGTYRKSDKQPSGRFEVDDAIKKQHVQQLIHCRLDKSALPYEIVRNLIAKVNNLQLYDNSTKSRLLFTTCAIVRKYLIDNKKEEWSMALENTKKDRSYQYGRLLAVLEKAERDTYDNNEKRETNAIRMQSVFVNRPAYATKIILEQVKNAYYPRLTPFMRSRYEQIIEEIMLIISECEGCDYNAPLSETYILGYYLQKAELYKKKDTNDMEENSDE